jgi:hypothetical protein
MQHEHDALEAVESCRQEFAYLLTALAAVREVPSGPASSAAMSASTSSESVGGGRALKPIERLVAHDGVPARSRNGGAFERVEVTVPLSGTLLGKVRRALPFPGKAQAPSGDGS